MLFVLAGLIALFVMARLRYPGRAPLRLEEKECDADLWKHVYPPDRLRVIEACTVVDGRVVSVHRASDGDLHVALDPENKSVLNLVNAIHAHRHLVVEIICERAPAGGDAVAACAGFTQPVAIPKVGDRIRVTGAYVTDTESGWNEIHPMNRIETLR